MSKKNPKVFSIEEADALLPELERSLARLRAQKEAYSRTHDLLFMHELVCAAERSNGFSEEKDDLEDGIHALEEAIEALAKDVDAIFEKGCLLRNIEKGRVDFPGIYGGEKVFFVWELGEPEIARYRLPGRSSVEKPIPSRAASRKRKAEA
jgi:hypothetical protein